MNRRIGTVTFKFLGSTLSLDPSNTLDDIKVYTKPTQELLFISNLGNLDLSQIEVYDILGNKISHLELYRKDQNTIELDTSVYSKGIYVVVLSGNTGSIAKKVIIN